MKQLLFKTNNDWTGFIIRLTIGLILFPHGAQKLLGVFGGYGFSGTMTFFTGTVHLPWIIGFLVIIIEFFGALLLMAGLGTRVWAALIVVLMLGIIFTTHAANGFFMNWFGNQKGEGFEFDLMMIGLSLAALLNGGGKYALDRLFMKPAPYSG